MVQAYYKEDESWFRVSRPWTGVPLSTAAAAPSKWMGKRGKKPQAAEGRILSSGPQGGRCDPDNEPIDPSLFVGCSSSAASYDWQALVKLHQGHGLSGSLGDAYKGEDIIPLQTQMATGAISEVSESVKAASVKSALSDEPSVEDPRMSLAPVESEIERSAQQVASAPLVHRPLNVKAMGLAAGGKLSTYI